MEALQELVFENLIDGVRAAKDLRIGDSSSDKSARGSAVHSGTEAASFVINKIQNEDDLRKPYELFAERGGGAADVEARGGGSGGVSSDLPLGSGVDLSPGSSETQVCSRSCSSLASGEEEEVAFSLDSKRVAASRVGTETGEGACLSFCSSLSSSSSPPPDTQAVRRCGSLRRVSFSKKNEGRLPAASLLRLPPSPFGHRLASPRGASATAPLQMEGSAFRSRFVGRRRGVEVESSTFSEGISWGETQRPQPVCLGGLWGGEGEEASSPSVPAGDGEETNGEGDSTHSAGEECGNSPLFRLHLQLPPFARRRPSGPALHERQGVLLEGGDAARPLPTDGEELESPESLPARESATTREGESVAKPSCVEEEATDPSREEHVCYREQEGSVGGGLLNRRPPFAPSFSKDVWQSLQGAAFAETQPQSASPQENPRPPSSETPSSSGLLFERRRPSLQKAKPEDLLDGFSLLPSYGGPPHWLSARTPESSTPATGELESCSFSTEPQQRPPFDASVERAKTAVSADRTEGDGGICCFRSAPAATSTTAEAGTGTGANLLPDLRACLFGTASSASRGGFSGVLSAEAPNAALLGLSRLRTLAAQSAFHSVCAAAPFKGPRAAAVFSHSLHGGTARPAFSEGEGELRRDGEGRTASRPSGGGGRNLSQQWSVSAEGRGSALFLPATPECYCWRFGRSSPEAEGGASGSFKNALNGVQEGSPSRGGCPSAGSTTVYVIPEDVEVRELLWCWGGELVDGEGPLPTSQLLSRQQANTNAEGPPTAEATALAGRRESESRVLEGRPFFAEEEAVQLRALRAAPPPSRCRETPAAGAAASEPALLRFHRGERVEVLVHHRDGWVYGRIRDQPHRRGWFPFYALLDPAGLGGELFVQGAANASSPLPPLLSPSGGSSRACLGEGNFCNADAVSVGGPFFSSGPTARETPF